MKREGCSILNESQEYQFVSLLFFLLVSAGAVAYFVKLLSSSEDNVIEQAVWALGNIAGWLKSVCMLGNTFVFSLSKQWDLQGLYGSLEPLLNCGEKDD